MSLVGCYLRAEIQQQQQPIRDTARVSVELHHQIGIFRMECQYISLSGEEKAILKRHMLDFPGHLFRARRSKPSGKIGTAKVYKNAVHRAVLQLGTVNSRCIGHAWDFV